MYVYTRYTVHDTRYRRVSCIHGHISDQNHSYIRLYSNSCIALVKRKNADRRGRLSDCRTAHCGAAPVARIVASSASFLRDIPAPGAPVAQLVVAPAHREEHDLKRYSHSTRGFAVCFIITTDQETMSVTSDLIKQLINVVRTQQTLPPPNWNMKLRCAK